MNSVIKTKTIEKKERNSNIELCRIFCMILIIAHHCVVHGGGVNIDLYPNRYIAWLLYPGGKICFNTFLAISTWFLVEQKFKTFRFVKSWMQVLFYSVFGAILFCAISGTKLTILQWISIVLPITGNSHGFASAYLALYLLLPFLGKIVNNLNKQQTKFMLILLFYFEIGSQLVGNLTWYFQKLPSELLLFVFCFFLAYYLKNWPPRILKNNIVLVIIVLSVWCFQFFIHVLQWKYPENYWIAYLINVSSDESSILNLLAGYSLFFIFYNIKIPTIKLINKIATTTFGILLIHDHNFLRGTFWFTIIQTPMWYDSRYFILRVFLYVGIIFVVCSIIDLLRQWIFDKTLYKSKRLLDFCQKIDDKLNTNTVRGD